MEQTLTSESLIGRISKMTIFDQFAQTIFVEHPSGVIEVERSQKEANTIKFLRTEIVYQLKNHRIISKKMNSSNLMISDLTEGQTISVDKSICKCASTDLNKLFIRELGRFKDTEQHSFNLFRQSLFNKIFNKNTQSDLIEEFIKIGKDMSWAIVPYNLLHVIYSSPKLLLSKEDNDKIIYHLGQVENISVYVNPDDTSGKIYFGTYDSIIILTNDKVNVIEDYHGMNYNFQYLFIEDGPIKSLQVV
jgi:hypothetical protein